jgi:uncharacterized membrane protein
MKSLLFFLVGAIAGGFAVHVYDQGRAGGDRFAGAGRAPEAIKGRLDRWHLSRDDVESDLARTGEIVRENARVAGERISDARILAEIKAKYVLDRDLSARDIGVEVRDGDVVLAGTVPSPELIGKAVALALDTEGVRHVAARLAVLPRG